MTANIGILRKIEPALLSKNYNFAEVVSSLDRIRAIPRQTFGPVILHPAHCFYAFMSGIEYGVVINYPSGGGILQNEIHTLWDTHEERVVDICVPHPGSEWTENNGNDARSTIRNAARILKAMEYPMKSVRLLYETPFIDDKLLDAICDEASTNGFSWIKTSTGVYSKTSLDDTARVARIAACYDVQVKAAGGISKLKDVIAHLRQGASIVGTSSWESIYAEVTK